MTQSHSLSATDMRVRIAGWRFRLAAGVMLLALGSAASAQVSALRHQAQALQQQIAEGVAASRRHWRVVEHLAQSMCDIEYNKSIINGGQLGEVN